MAAAAASSGRACRACAEPDRRLLQPRERLGSRPRELLQLARLACASSCAIDRVEEAPEQAAVVQGSLRPDQVERLDAVRALVDLADAGVARQLLDARLGDVAVPAVDADREVRGLGAVVGAARPS